jgi:hypothetical protein
MTMDYHLEQLYQKSNELFPIELDKLIIGVERIEDHSPIKKKTKSVKLTPGYLIKAISG